MIRGWRPYDTGSHRRSESELLLRFAARLEDRAGRTLGRSFGSVTPTRLADLVSARSAVAEALALMFEKVAADCFVPLERPAAARAAGPRPEVGPTRASAPPLRRGA